MIRENYKNYEEQIKTSNTIVFLWKKKNDIEEASYENIRQDMQTIFKKAKLFIEEE